MKIVVDAMGGDYAPLEVVKGAIDAARVYNLDIILTGEKEQIHKELVKYDTKDLNIEVEDAPEIIAMGEHPATAVRKKKNSSIVVANRLVKEGRGDAVVSAGNTGAAMAASFFNMGRIKGIDRPAIASLLPTTSGFVLLLDAGANADCKPENLLQFGIMGSIYMNKIMDIANPKVGLLNIGEEDTKGNEIYQQANQLLSTSSINFIGNVEGRDITNATADVVVCDGFVGNVVLKFAEGLSRDIFGMIKEEVKKGFISKIGAAMFFSKAKGLKKKLDQNEIGGAPLLGIDGVSIIGHGSSNAYAVKNAIRVAKECIDCSFVEEIRKSI